jgi:putative oxidoreductase
MKKFLVGSNENLTNWGILILRVAIGIVMFAHGSQKVLGIWGGKGLDTTVTMMSGMLGIPPFLVYLSAFTEFLGGLGLLLGVLTRFFGIAVIINMLVAVLAVHLKNGFFAPMGFEYPGTLACIALAITIAGPGRYSLDHIIFSGKDTDSIQPREVSKNQ